MVNTGACGALNPGSIPGDRPSLSYDKTPPMKEHFFEERGIYYRTNDLHPDRPTLLFVHGLSGSSSVWLPYERYFEDSYDIVSLDLRGHGKSRKFFLYSAYSPELIADDIVALLNHLAIPRCIVIGHSFGALLALVAIKEMPQKFSAAIFISPTYGVSFAWWLPIARALALAFGFLSLLLPFDSNPRGHIDYAKLAPTGDWSLRRVVPDIRNTSLRVYVFCMKHIYKLDTDKWWRGLNIPTLIVHGKKDTIVHVRNAKSLAHLIPTAQLVVIEGGNHILPVNNFEDVCAEIARFLAAVDKARI